MKSYKKWLNISLSSFIVIVIIVSIFNYKIDHLGIFHKSNYLSEAAKSLVDGKMIAGIGNYDERLFQEYLIKEFKSKIDIVVLGSSRTMQFRKRFFGNQEKFFFNHSVSGARLGDYIAIIGAYEKIKGMLPSTVILGIDPWIFNKQGSQGRWQKTYYDHLMKKMYLNTKNLENSAVNTIKWKQLFNSEYTISNFKFFKNMLKNLKSKRFYITDTFELDDSIKETDGSLHYPYVLRYPNYDEVRKKAIDYTEGKVYQLENFNRLGNKRLFEDFITYLRSKGVEVIIYLPPYNPVAYDILIKNKKYKNIVVSENYLIEYAKKNKLELYGSYNPHVFNLTNKDFFDGMHSNEHVVEKILKNKKVY